MDTGVVVEAGGRAELAAAVGSMAGLVDELTGVVAFPPAAPDGPSRLAGSDADPLQELSSVCLDGLGLVARLEAVTAALKVRLVAAYAKATDTMEGPPASAYEASAQEMSKVAGLHWKSGAPVTGSRKR
ncbi:hypothetical protein [Pseudarthrobacter oxydans]|jgi:hypothetical protein|uniref:hypothetical protein n=1 Tax=Pseudarthrobacter oxydans TaxID=1671 RepID=UPI003413EB69|nr:hypothetical protein GCM10017547_22400 [Pseudarthrobacter oxydans]